MVSDTSKNCAMISGGWKEMGSIFTIAYRYEIQFYKDRPTSDFFTTVGASFQGVIKIINL